MIQIRNSEGHKQHTVQSMPQYGIERAMGVSDWLPVKGEMIAFRLYDDDGNLTHYGELTDDDECVNQMAALRYGETDKGATVIKVKRDGDWIQEIG